MKPLSKEQKEKLFAILNERAQNGFHCEMSKANKRLLERLEFEVLNKK